MPRGESKLCSARRNSRGASTPFLPASNTFPPIKSSFLEAFEKNLPAGSTAAVVAILVDGQILVANVGDSKALLCSEKLQRHLDLEADGSSMAYLSVKELTSDHNPHREEERARIEAAGGIFYEYDIPVINGNFPMTRAIGDVPIKRYGIIRDPEVTDWQPLTANDSYLVVLHLTAYFESLKPQEVCSLLGDAHTSKAVRNRSTPQRVRPFPRWPTALVRNAFEKGSTDNYVCGCGSPKVGWFFPARH